MWGQFDAYNKLTLNDIHLGESYDKVIQSLGKPDTLEENEILKITTYENPGLGIVIEFYEDKVKKVTGYPEYITEDLKKNIPKTVKEVYEVFGSEYKESEQSCYETAKCKTLLFKESNQNINVLLRWDNETVDRIDLYYGE